MIENECPFPGSGWSVSIGYWIGNKNISISAVGGNPYMSSNGEVKTSQVWRWNHFFKHFTLYRKESFFWLEWIKLKKVIQSNGATSEYLLKDSHIISILLKFFFFLKIKDLFFVVVRIKWRISYVRHISKGRSNWGIHKLSIQLKNMNWK